ncbi:MAG: aminotransferase class I/II-fold pyridoxal phosphate-dependent enzyme [Bacteroidetes bacterium]|nr:aminotransferase class I/II-fold pyridoxal phosphate-dependent enzyme [Bacteroidota bacterium]
MEIIDLRSDTVTKPTTEMLQAMIHAEVGDDVFNEDATVLALEKRVSAMFGKESGLFVPSGTMSNQLAIKVLTQSGEEVIIDESGHIFNYEGTTAGWLSNVQLRPVLGKLGKLTPALIEAAIRPRNDWDPHTSVIEIENTANKGGGTAYTRQELIDIKVVAEKHHLLVHLDGARIWNAITATGIEPEFFGTIAETISVCFSKGLGAPVGSMLLGSTERIKKARRFRKILGGGMRQVGLLAAAADYAITHNWKKMAEDHRKAKELAELIHSRNDIEVSLEATQTNIVIFELKEIMATEFMEKATTAGLRVVPFGPKKVRIVYHFQITDSMHKKVLAFFENF